MTMTMVMMVLMMTMTGLIVHEGKSRTNGLEREMVRTGVWMERWESGWTRRNGPVWEDAEGRRNAR
jgi:hypothetical protein